MLALVCGPFRHKLGEQHAINDAVVGKDLEFVVFFDQLHGAALFQQRLGGRQEVLRDARFDQRLRQTVVDERLAQRAVELGDPAFQLVLFRLVLLLKVGPLLLEALIDLRRLLALRSRLQRLVRRLRRYRRGDLPAGFRPSSASR